MRKGIFWCTDFDTEAPALITVSVACDKNGDSKGAGAVQLKVRQ